MLSCKKTTESIIITFDFSMLAPSVSSPNVSASHLSGSPDGSPSGILSGPPSVVGAKVLQRVTGGIAGCNYQLMCVANAPDSSVYELVDILPVVAPAP